MRSGISWCDWPLKGWLGKAYRRGAERWIGACYDIMRSLIENDMSLAKTKEAEL